jgi:hypothetical protein
MLTTVDIQVLQRIIINDQTVYRDKDKVTLYRCFVAKQADHLSHRAKIGASRLVFWPSRQRNKKIEEWC